MIEIVERGPESLLWDFGEVLPSVMVGQGRRGGRRTTVDPFPCYPHDLAVVWQVAGRLESVFPIDRPVRIHVLHFEEVGRTNGWSQWDPDDDGETDGKGRKPILFSIALNGRRTPIHPAVTRFLVAHEYGHIVSRWIGYRAGLRDHEQEQLEAQYAEIRGIDPAELPAHYGARTWDQDAGEIMADDFRVLVAGVETEFWPHRVPRPEGIDEIARWWHSARLEHGGVDVAAAAAELAARRELLAEEASLDDRG